MFKRQSVSSKPLVLWAPPRGRGTTAECAHHLASWPLSWHGDQSQPTKNGRNKHVRYMRYMRYLFFLCIFFFREDKTLILCEALPLGDSHILDFVHKKHTISRRLTTFSLENITTTNSDTLKTLLKTASACKEISSASERQPISSLENMHCGF